MQEANQENKGESNELCLASRSSITQPNGTKLLGIKESKSEMINANDKDCNSSKNLVISNQKQHENDEMISHDKLKQVGDNSVNNNRASLNNGLAIQVNSEEIDPSKSLDKGNSSKTNPPSGLQSYSDRKDDSCLSRNTDIDDDRFHRRKQTEPRNYNFLSPDVSNDGRCSRSYSQNDIMSDRMTSTKDDESVRSLNLKADHDMTIDKVKRKVIIRMSSFHVKPPPGRAAHRVVGAR